MTNDAIEAIARSVGVAAAITHVAVRFAVALAWQLAQVFVVALAALLWAILAGSLRLPRRRWRIVQRVSRNVAVIY